MGAELYGEEKISENGRDAGNNEKKDHDYAVKRKQRVIRVGAHDRSAGKHEFGPYAQANEHGNDKPGDDDRKIHQTYTFMIEGYHPGQNPFEP